MTPQRIQLSRRRGFRLPAGAVNVARPSRWGNPYRVTQHGDVWRVDFLEYASKTEAVEAAVLLHRFKVEHERPDLSALRGRDLACWCPLDSRCHADTLIRLANS